MDTKASTMNSGTTTVRYARADPGEFPLHAITQRPMQMYHSWHSQNAWLRQILGQNRLFINRITEVATFAHGEVAAIAAFVGFTVFQATGVPFVVAVACSIIAGGVLGFAIERIVIRPVQTSESV